MENDWKKRLGVVYSTDPDFNFNKGELDQDETLPADKQDLRVMLDRKNRKGKTVTIVRGFRGATADLEELGKKLKKRCGTGGSVKDGEIIVQGDFCKAIISYLQSEGYGVKRSGG